MAAVTLGQIADSEPFVWDCFRLSLGRWLRKNLKDIPTCQLIPRRANRSSAATCVDCYAGKLREVLQQYMKEIMQEEI